LRVEYAEQDTGVKACGKRVLSHRTDIAEIWVPPSLQPSDHIDGVSSCCRSPVSVSIPYWTPFILYKSTWTLSLNFDSPFHPKLPEQKCRICSQQTTSSCIWTPSLRNHFLWRLILKLTIAFLKVSAQLWTAAGRDWQHRERVGVLHNVVYKIPSGVVRSFLSLQLGHPFTVLIKQTSSVNMRENRNGPTNSCDSLSYELKKNYCTTVKVQTGQRQTRPPHKRTPKNLTTVTRNQYAEDYSIIPN
jgi:hypothetical protein